MSDGNYVSPDHVDDVVNQEYLQIQARRAMALARTEIDPASEKFVNILEEAGKDVPQEERRLIGLALSGGGIRSATFGLGVLQGLAELGLLKFCDYLSTVSGGGYIGSWLAAWIKREGSIDNVEKQLRPTRADQADAHRGFTRARPWIRPGTIHEDEPEPIAHLREFGRFLAPRLDLMSTDGWTLVAIYIRNLIANQLAVLPALLAVMLLVVGVEGIFSANWSPYSPWAGNAIAAIAGLMMIGGFVFFTWGLRIVSDPKRAGSTHPVVGLKCLAGTLMLVGLACVLFTSVLLPNPTTMLVPRISQWKWLAANSWFLSAPGGSHVPSISPWILFTFALGWGLFHAVFSYFVANSWGRLLSGLLSGATAGILLYLMLFYVLWHFAPVHKYAFAATFGPPLMLMIFSLANIVDAALLSRLATEQEREWRSRYNAWAMIVTTLWISIVGLALYGHYACKGVFDACHSPGWRGWATISAVTSWLLAVIGGLRAAAGSKTNGDNRPNWIDLFVRVTPFVFLAGMSIILAEAAHWLATTHDVPVSLGSWHAVVEVANGNWLWGSFGVCVAVSTIMSWRVDVNRFSLNAMYASRLVRCFLGASRRKSNPDLQGTPAHCHGPEWNPNPVTGLDPRDDINLPLLQIGGPRPTADDLQDPDKDLAYWGPFPLINTALNLVAGDRLAWQERRAESFMLSPLFCGCKSLGYRRAKEYAANYDATRPLTLGRSMAISGAAANPNMGYYSSPAVAALLTLFNVRLGWWLPNPVKASDPKDLTWKERAPGFLLKWLAIEALSLTNSSRSFLNISDGGHFDNLGVYELVRRRCRLIIIADAGADPLYQCQELGMVIRKCRTDFGIDIEIDTSQLQPAANGNCKWHCAIGTIRYDHVNPKAPVGTLVYIKPSLTGDEPADVRNYAEAHATFPHQSTLNQFYNESQFESYRALGHHCVMEVMQDACRRLGTKLNAVPPTDPLQAVELTQERASDMNDWARRRHGDVAENLVYRLRTRWLAPAAESHEDFLESVENFKQLQCDMRDKPDLEPISRDLYPDLPWNTATGDFAIRPAEVHSSSLMLQIMENAYLAADLENMSTLPLNAGWINLFHRWSQTYVLRRYWPLLRNEYGHDFVFFCQRELALKADPQELEPLTDTTKISDETWRQIVGEFNREWPDEKSRHGGIDNIRTEAVRYEFESTKTAAWFIRVKPPEGTLKPGDPLSEGFVAGIVAVRPLPAELKLNAVELAKVIPKLDRNEDGVVDDSSFWDWKQKKNLEQKFTDSSKKPFATEVDRRPGYELVVWVRPGFRYLEVGQELLEQFIYKKLSTEKAEDKPLDKTGDKPLEKTEGMALRSALGGGDPTKFKLAVYFPKSRPNTSDDKFAGVAQMWLSFFSFYGFRRSGRDWPQSMNDEVLVWDPSQY